LRIVAISDIHGDQRARGFIDGVIEASSPDLLVICGDITTFGPASFAESLLSGLKVRCAAVPGNCDPAEVLEIIEKHCISLHGRRVEIDSIQFVGLGGAPLCSRSTPLELDESEIDSFLSRTMIEKCVVVSHAPPVGTNDITRSGKSLGSSSLARYVERYRPRLLLSGHVHEARSIVEKNGTVFANPGPLKGGFAVVAELSASGTTAKLVDFNTILGFAHKTP
jgi:Icc-related predicted phosphoesterase